MSEQQNNGAGSHAGVHAAASQPAATQPPIPPQPPVTTSPPLPPLPTTPPSSQSPTVAIAPGWRFQPGNPGTDAQASAIVDSRVIDSSKIFNGGIDPNLPNNPGMAPHFASNTVAGAPNIVELARALKNDPQLIFEFVYNNIDWQPGWGVMKGALGALLDGSGNSFDQSLLLAALLRQAGYTANIVKGQIQLKVQDYDAWFGTNSSVNSYCCYWYAQYANIPGTAPTWDGTNWNMVMSHVWVQVVISGTTYVLDPSRKSYNRPVAVAVGGTKTTGNVLTVTVNDAGLSGGTTNVSYTVLAGDTLNTISQGIAAAINASGALAAIGVTAGSTASPMPAQFTIGSRSKNPTTYSFSVTGTETLTVTTQSSLLASMMNYSQSTFLADAESGATIDGSGNFVQNMNTTNIASDLKTMTSNLVSYIKNNTVGNAPAGTAIVDDVLGGSQIVPIKLPFTWNTTLSYELSGDTPTIWTGDVPLTYKTTLEVQYPLSPSGWAIDQTFTSDQLAGGRLTLTFDGSLHPVLTLNGTVVATGSQAQSPGSWNSVQLTVNHNAYSSPVYPQQWWQSFIYAGQYYLIGNAWGSVGRGQADFHQTQLAATLANSGSTTEAINGEWMSTIWWNWAAQSSRVADLAGRMNSTYPNFFHQVGIVSYTLTGGVPTPGTDIGGVSGFCSTLNYDFTQLSRTNTVVAMHGVACEAATLAQFNGLTPGVSTTTVIDKANRTAVFTIGGTKHTGDTLTITVNDPALSGGTKSKTYTVLAADTLTTIAAGLTSLINGDSSLSAIGVTATSSGTVILVSSTSVNQTSYTVSKSTGATETIAVAWSKIYLATTSNWSTGINISATLTANGYTSGQISTIGGYVSSTQNVMIGDQPSYKLGGYNGLGYWALPHYANNGGAYGLIAGTAKGGFGQNGVGEFGANPNPVSSSPSTQQHTGDPIALGSGDFLYSSNDLSIGSGDYPYNLTFQRFYSSANQYNNGPLGLGWSHGFQMSATVGSDGLLGMGSQFAVQGAASIVELFVTMDLGADSTQPIAKVVTMSLADKWWVDQIVNNTVVVSLPQDTSVFVKQPDGSYTAPARNPSTLTLTSGAYSVKTPQGVKYNFNTSGQISTIVYPNGVTITFTYTSGKLTSVTNGMGRTLTLHYTGSLLTSVTDGTGRTVSYTVTSNNLVTFTDANSKNTTYSYDNPGRMTAYYLPANPLTAFATNVYDSLSRVKTQANANSQVWTYYFAGPRTEIDDPVGNAQVSYFNNLGAVTRSIDGLGNEWDNVYDGLNRLIQTTMPEGNQVVLTYDANNNILTRIKIPKSGSGLANVVETFTYDSTWAKMKTCKDGNLNTTTFNYDATLGNLLTIQRPAIGGITPTVTNRWNSRGQLISTIDETGIQTQLNYDTSTEKLTSVVQNTNWTATIAGTVTVGNVLQLTAHDTALSGGLETVSYTVVSGDTLTKIATGLAAAVNADSNLAAVGIVAYSIGAVVMLATAKGNATTWTKTVTGTETITLAAGLNLTTSLGYDSVGNVNSLTDPNLNAASFVFDTLRRMTQKTDPTPFSYVTNINWDDNGNLLNIQRQTGGTPAWQINSWTYYPTNKKHTATDPASNATTWTYDAADRLQTMTDAQSRQWQYSYDACNRLYQVTDPTTTVCDTRTYSNNGLLSSVKDVRNNTTQYSYDGLDRPNKTTYADTTFEQNSSYDANGNVLTRLSRSGNSIVTTFDVLNRPATKTPTSQPVITYTFDLAGRLTQISKPVVSGDPSTGAIQFFFDSAGRFNGEQYPDGKTVTHVLDANGNRTQTTWPDGYFVTRVFDQLNRLTNIKLNGSATSAVVFSYNQLSQRTQLTYSNGATVVYTPQLNEDVSSIAHNFVGSSVTFTYGFNNVHEPNSVAVSDSTYMWHPAGAATTTYGTADSVNNYPTVGGTSYSYDGNKNLTGDGTWTYTFDTENHLLTASKTGTSASMVYDPLHRQSQKTVGSAKTRYIYSEWQRIADYDGVAGTLQNRYVYGTSMDEALIMVSSGGTVTFLHADIVGTIVATSNSSGSVTNKNLYSTFGEVTTLGGTSFGFTGQRFDSELGLYYFKMRYYSPTLGRFLQTDPLSYTSEDFNLYSMVNNSPLNHVDPMGMVSIQPGGETNPFSTWMGEPGLTVSGALTDMDLVNYIIDMIFKAIRKYTLLVWTNRAGTTLESSVNGDFYTFSPDLEVQVGKTIYAANIVLVYPGGVIRYQPPGVIVRPGTSEPFGTDPYGNNHIVSTLYFTISNTGNNSSPTGQTGKTGYAPPPNNSLGGTSASAENSLLAFMGLLSTGGNPNSIVSGIPRGYNFGGAGYGPYNGLA